MQLYLPKGAEMSQQDQDAWVEEVTALSEEYHNDAPEPVVPYDVDAYDSKACHIDYSEFITPMWQEHYTRAEELFRKREKRFLEDDLIRYAFFFTGGGIWQEKQLKYLRSHWLEEELLWLLKEDHIFFPTISSREYWSSECVIHHLTHFTVFKEKTGFDFSQLDTVIEFGGGYGGMCRLLRRLAPGTTHVIIDLPIFLFFQQFFLKNIFGEDSVNMILDDGDDVVESKINLVPVPFSKTLGNLHKRGPDLFIATWSLSEANQHSVDYVTNMGYFDASHLLMAYRHYQTINPRQPCSDALTLTPGYSEVFRDTTFYALADEQHYFFARRE